MTSGSDPFSILNKNPDRGLWRKPEPKPKVNMYRAGKEPKLQGKNEGEDSSDGNIFSDSDNKTEISKFTKNTNLKTFLTEDRTQLKTTIIKHSSVVINNTPNPETAAPAAPVKETQLVVGEVEVVDRRRRKAAPTPADPTTTSNNQQEENDGLGKRKLEQRDEPPTPKPHIIDKEEQEEADDEDSVDLEGEEEEDHGGPKQMTRITRPVFIRSQIREDHDKMLEDEEWQARERERVKQSIEHRNKQLVVEAKNEREDKDADQLSDSEVDLPNDSEEETHIAYERWKIRELSRLRRDKEESEKLFKEKEAIERRRLMTDEERAQDDKRIGKYKEDLKSNYRFMQKYYDVGIYNIDENDPLFKRDYNIAVGEDLFDKSFMPTIKQVRRGDEHKKGKSKYTHLVAEDTTNFDPEYLPYEDIRSKQLSMTAGYKSANQFDRPSLKKR